jgi:uncharacterized membrane protein
MSEKPPDEVLELARRQIAARREAEQHQQMQTQQTQTQRERPWRYIFLGLMGTLLLALLFTPGLPLQWKMYAVVHGVCAQQHNIFIGELQVPICARNSGIYISFLITMIYFWGIGRGHAGRVPPWPIAAVLIAFVVVMGIDGFNSLFLDLGLPYLYTPRNELRTLTGMGMGVGVATVMLLILNTTLRQNVDDQQPLLKNWRELGGVLLLNFLILVALYGNLELLYWPLAFLSFTGIISVLYLVSLLLVSLFMGYEGRVTHPAQLAKPATIALLPTLVMLAVMSGLRFWLEAQGLII